MIRKIAWSCFVVLVMALSAGWLTRPLVFGMWDHVYDLYDAIYTVWALDHNYQVIGSGRWSSYWEAPMLIPYPRSLVLADAHLGSAIWTYPAFMATGNAVFCQNAAILGSYVLTGVGCYLLASTITQRRWLALVVGLAGMAIPFRQAQLLHLPVLMTQWLPLSVWCLLACARRPQARWVIGVGLTAVLTLFSALYYGIFSSLLLAPLAISLGWRHGWFRRGVVLRAGVWVSVVLTPLVIWFVFPYYYVYRLEGFERPLTDIISGSAQPQDFLKVNDRYWVADVLGLAGDSWSVRESSLFPGVAFGVGLATSLFWAARDGGWLQASHDLIYRFRDWVRGRSDLTIGLIGVLLLLIWWLFLMPFSVTKLDLSFDFMPVPWPVISGTFLLVLITASIVLIVPRVWRSGWLAARGHVFWCWGGLVLFVLLSFGPVIRCGGIPLAVGPYALLYRFVPGFQGMRVPARLCVLFLPLFVLLTTAALDRLASAFPNRLGRQIVPVLAILLVAADHWVKPVQWQRVPQDVPAAFRWLKDNGQPGGAFVMPADTLQRQPSPLYLFYALHHRRAMLNGFPAFMPADCETALRLANTFPNPDALQVLNDRGVAYVVVDRVELAQLAGGPDVQATLAECERTTRVRRIESASDDRFILFELRAPKAVAPRP
jgi:hypothetical protein